MKRADQWFEDHKADKYYSMITFIKDIQRDVINSSIEKIKCQRAYNGYTLLKLYRPADVEKDIMELLEEIKPND